MIFTILSMISKNAVKDSLKYKNPKTNDIKLDLTDSWRNFKFKDIHKDFVEPPYMGYSIWNINIERPTDDYIKTANTIASFMNECIAIPVLIDDKVYVVNWVPCR